MTQVMALPSADVTVHNLRPLTDAAHFAGRARGVLRCRECKKKCYFYCVTCSPDPTKPAGLVALCGLATERAWCCFRTSPYGTVPSSPSPLLLKSATITKLGLLLKSWRFLLLLLLLLLSGIPFRAGWSLFIKRHRQGLGGTRIKVLAEPALAPLAPR